MWRVHANGPCSVRMLVVVSLPFLPSSFLSKSPSTIVHFKCSAKNSQFNEEIQIILISYIRVLPLHFCAACIFFHTFILWAWWNLIFSKEKQFWKPFFTILRRFPLWHYGYVVSYVWKKIVRRHVFLYTKLSYYRETSPFLSHVGVSMIPLFWWPQLVYPVA